MARVNDQTSIHSLAVPSTTGVEKTLAKGGTFISRFANDVVLNFNGSQGLTSRISSDLLFGFTQSILQRDILLDPLIQSERNLVYAARRFARFRKEFFFDVASDYYDILKYLSPRGDRVAELFFTGAHAGTGAGGSRARA